MSRLLAALFLLIPLSAHAQRWSVGVATGPFVFGDFVERTLRQQAGEGTGVITQRLSAATRAGLAVDIQRQFSDRFAVRLEGTFTRSPLGIKGDDNDAVTLDAGDVDVATFMLPLVFTINPNGSLRFHVLGGPAYAAYRIATDEGSTLPIRVFEGTRTEWGYALGGGVGWHWTDHFALEGGLTDVVTSSPFRKSEFAASARVQIPRPHNIHTTIGLRYRF